MTNPARNSPKENSGANGGFPACRQAGSQTPPFPFATSEFKKD